MNTLWREKPFIFLIESVMIIFNFDLTGPRRVQLYHTSQGKLYLTSYILRDVALFFKFYRFPQISAQAFPQEQSE